MELKEDIDLQKIVLGLFLKLDKEKFKDSKTGCLICDVLKDYNSITVGEACTSCYYCCFDKSLLNYKRLLSKNKIIKSLLKSFPYLIKYYPAILIDKDCL